MLEPKLSARMMESLELGADDHVLDVGTGSGYLCALMATVCAHVTTVEIDPRLLDIARRNLGVAGIRRVIDLQMPATFVNFTCHAYTGRNRHQYRTTNKELRTHSNTSSAYGAAMMLKTG